MDVPTILILDSDRLFIDQIQELYPGRRILQTDNPVTAYQNLETENIAIMTIENELLTYHTGLEIAINVKKHYPYVKTLLTTDDTNFDLLKNALNSGSVDTFISKPIDSMELSEVIENTWYQINSRNNALEKIIQNLRNGISISDDLIGDLGGELELLKMLYHESIQETHIHNHTCIGVSISKGNDVIIQKYLDDVKIKNKILFSAFAETLRAFGLKFDNSESNTITLGKIMVKITHRNGLVYTVFLKNITSSYIINTEEFIKDLEKIIDTAHLDDEQLGPLIDTFNESLTK